MFPSVSAELNSIKKSYGFDEDGRFHGVIDENERNLHTYTTRQFLTSYKPVVVAKAFVTGSTAGNGKQRYLVSLLSKFFTMYLYIFERYYLKKWNQYGTIISSYNGDVGRIEVSLIYK